MHTNHDFRSLLDVHPSDACFTCVGLTQKKARCRQSMISNSDKARASAILDRMDARTDLSECVDDLKELAEATLCPRWHRSVDRDQVREVTMRWGILVTTYAAQIKRERKKAAMAEAGRPSVKTTKAVRARKVKPEEAIVKQEIAPVMMTTEIEVESSVSAKLKSRAPVVSVKSVPDFTVADITPPPSQNNTPARDVKSDEAGRCDDRTTIETPCKSRSLESTLESPIKISPLSEEVKVEQDLPATPTKSLPLKTFLTPKTSPLPMPNARAISEHPNERGTIVRVNFPPTPDATPDSDSSRHIKAGFSLNLKTSPLSALRNEALNIARDERAKTTKVHVKLPPTPDATPEPDTRQDVRSEFVHKETVDSAPIVSFNAKLTEAFSASLSAVGQTINSEPAVLKNSSVFDSLTSAQIPVSKDDPFVTKSRRTILAPKTRKKTALVSPSPLELSSQAATRSFDFSMGVQIPHSEGYSFVFDSTRPSLGPKSPKKTSPIPSTRVESTPEATMKPAETIGIHDQEEVQEESYGYANVTSSSRVYMSSLPHPQHSDRPETSSPPQEGPRAEAPDPFFAEALSSPRAPKLLARKSLPVPRDSLGLVAKAPSSRQAPRLIARKPLPVPHGSLKCVADVRMPETHDAESGPDGRVEDSGGEEEKVGCFHSRRLRRLAHGLARKVKALKTKVSKKVP